MHITSTLTKLSNGLPVITYRDSSTPVVAVNLWYFTGSAYERPGKTGLAHLFEHMMFQGSQNVEKGMHFRLIQDSGGSLNGSTSFDRTNYYEKLPAEELELALWLESDRMGFFLPSLTEEKFKNQVDVVYNERLERYDNQPYGLAWEKLLELVYPAGHPYSWPTIGYGQDIRSYTLDDVKDFFSTHYRPGNASLVIAGDIDEDAALKAAEKYFGSLPDSLPPSPVPLFPTDVKKAAASIVLKDNVQVERLYLAVHTVPAYDADEPALQFISEALTGSKNGRLISRLVYELEIAQSVSSFQFSGRFAGLFIIMVNIKPGVLPAMVKNELLQVVTTFVTEGPTEEELTRIKNGIRSDYVYSLQSIEAIANQLNTYYAHLGVPDYFNQDLGRYLALNPEQILNSAGKYLTAQWFELLVTGKGE